MNPRARKNSQRGKQRFVSPYAGSNAALIAFCGRGNMKAIIRFAYRPTDAASCFRECVIAPPWRRFGSVGGVRPLLKGAVETVKGASRTSHERQRQKANFRTSCPTRGFTAVLLMTPNVGEVKFASGFAN